MPHDKDPENSRRKNDPLQQIQHRELLTTRFVHVVRCRRRSVRFEDRSPQEQSNGSSARRTLKVEIAKSRGRRRQRRRVPQQRRAQRSLLEWRTGGAIDDAVLTGLREPGGMSPGEIGRRLSMSRRGPFRKREREQGAFLNATQQTLIKEKFEILQQASFGFTQDRLLHISQEESKIWTKECTDELRSKIASVAPSHVQIVLIDFPKLGCVSLQCLPLGLLPAPVYS